MCANATSAPHHDFDRPGPLQAAPPPLSPPAVDERQPLAVLGRRLRDLLNPRASDLQRMLSKLEAQFQSLEKAHARFLAVGERSCGDADGDLRQNPTHLVTASMEPITDIHYAGRSATCPAVVRLSALLRDRDRFGCILEVWLNDNHISDAGAAALASYLAAPSCALLELWLGRNRIGPVGTRALAAALCESSASRLKCLGLYLNPIGNEGAAALAQMLKKNHMLTTVDLHGCLKPSLPEARQREEEVGITELYGGGCGCKVITPYDGAEYLAHVIANGAVEGASFVTERRFVDAVQTFAVFNRINPTREQAVRGITGAEDDGGGVQTDTALLLSDLRDRPARERLDDGEKFAWKDCEWQRRYARTEQAHANGSAPRTDAHTVGDGDGGGGGGDGDVEMRARSAAADDVQEAPSSTDRRCWRDLKRDIKGTSGAPAKEEIESSRAMFTISDAEE